MFIRYCPICNKEICHRNKYSRNYAQKQNKSCRKCSNNSPERLEKRREIYKNSLGNMDWSGENNGFYGKTHTEETKIKIHQSQKNRIRTEEEKEKSREKLKKYGNTRHCFEIWKEKYSPEIYKQKIKEFKEKQSESHRGKNNSMYGKPSPQGSGNGWSGWYKNWFFRSLRELSYMINVIEVNNYKWECCEKKKFQIKYIDYKEQERNYYPDFFIDQKYIIEIKPKKLWNTPSILAKKKGAEVYCKNKGYIYQLVDIEIIDFEEIVRLYNEKIIKFLDVYEIKLQRMINEKNTLYT